MTGIIMDRECVDIYNPKTIRSTMGSVYRMPFRYTENLAEAVKNLKERGIRTYAAMKGQVESLNAAVAASILIFEAAGQRRRLSGSQHG